MQYAGNATDNGTYYNTVLYLSRATTLSFVRKWSMTITLLCSQKCVTASIPKFIKRKRRATFEKLLPESLYVCRQHEVPSLYFILQDWPAVPLPEIMPMCPQL